VHVPRVLMIQAKYLLSEDERTYAIGHFITIFTSSRLSASRLSVEYNPAN
jgi:hypothetical protein